jgi:hypothetical protein
VFYDASIAGNNHKQSTAYTTPGDNNQMCVRRAFVDTSKQTLTANTDIGQAIPLSINEVVLGVWCRVATAESTANATFTIGLDADNERFIDSVVATTANTVASEWDIYHVSSNTQHITVYPGNGVDLDTAVIEVSALISKSFDADGDVPSPGYAIPIGG